MVKVYKEEDTDLTLIQSKKVGIIGYGSQGSAQALNLKSSGVEVIVSELEGTPNYERALQDGFKPVSAEQLSKDADVIQILVQDPAQPALYSSSIEPNLKEGNALMFSHGFNIHFKQIIPLDFVDVIMVAPKGPGALVRQTYEEGKGVPCLVAVYQDSSGKAKDLAMSYAAAIGGARAGLIETTFAEETETDLFGEQAVLCGGVTELIKAGFDTLTQAGYQPEIAYFECLHELKLITDLIYRRGIAGMRDNISDTAEYGDLSKGSKVIDKRVRKQMKKLLSDIRSGRFAREWIKEDKLGRPNMSKMKEEQSRHPIEEIGRQLRRLMPWTEE